MAKILDIVNFWNPSSGRPIDASQYNKDIKMLVEAINNSVSEDKERLTSVETWNDFKSLAAKDENKGKLYFVKNSGGADGHDGIGLTEPVFAYVIPGTIQPGEQNFQIIKTWDEILKLIPKLDVSNLHPDQIISGVEAHVSEHNHVADALGITSEMLEGLKLLTTDVVNKIKTLDVTDLVHKHELDVDQNGLLALKADVVWPHTTRKGSK